jgi:hypothetical protein
MSTILILVLVLWLLGYLGHVGGGLIHLLLIVALVVWLVDYLAGRRPPL